MIEILSIRTKGNTDIVNITDKIENIVKKAEFTQGIVNVFVRHTTASIAIMENEHGALQDFKEALEKLAPLNNRYNHNEIQDDDNASSHIRGALQGPSVSIPFKNSKMLLGTWQQVFVVDFDTHERDREVVVSIVEIN